MSRTTNAALLTAAKFKSHITALHVEAKEMDRERTRAIKMINEALHMNAEFDAQAEAHPAEQVGLVKVRSKNERRRKFHYLAVASAQTVSVPVQRRVANAQNSWY